MTSRGCATQTTPGELSVLPGDGTMRRIYFGGKPHLNVARRDLMIAVADALPGGMFGPGGWG